MSETTERYFYRIVYVIESRMRFLSHKELMRVIARALRRAGLPLAYSCGYHPHPRISYGPPRPVGMAGQAEEYDVELTAPVACAEMRAHITAQFPRGIRICEVTRTETKQSSITASVVAADYSCNLPEGCQLPAGAMSQLMQKQHIEYTRTTKKGVKKMDVRPGIYAMKPKENGVEMTLSLRSDLYVRPQDVLGELTGWRDDRLQRIIITRTALLRTAPSPLPLERYEAGNFS